MVEIRKVTVVVLVRDLDRALRFYRDLLGLTIEDESEEWVFFCQGIGLMVSPEPIPEDAINLNAVTVSLAVDDVDAAYDELVKKGVAFLVPPTDAGGARVASFRDSEGNVLQLVR